MNGQAQRRMYHVEFACERKHTAIMPLEDIEAILARTDDRTIVREAHERIEAINAGLSKKAICLPGAACWRCQE